MTRINRVEQAYWLQTMCPESHERALPNLQVVADSRLDSREY